MAEYLGILSYTSVDSSGCNPIQCKEIIQFEEDKNPVDKFRELESKMLRGAFTNGEHISRLYEISREIKLD